MKKRKKPRRSVRECVKVFPISIVVFAHITRVEGYQSIRYIANNELLSTQCCRALRAIAVWRCTSVRKCKSGDVAACPDEHGPALKLQPVSDS